MEKDLRIAICDDELSYATFMQNVIEAYLESMKTTCEIDIYGSGEALLNGLDQAALYTIIFLDVNMQNLNGIQTAEKIRAYSEDTFIVFVTSYIDYSLDGYRVNAFRYILKEEQMRTSDAIEECVDAIMKKTGIGMKNHKISFRFVEGERTISLSQLMSVESVLHKLIFKVKEKDKLEEYTYYGKLDDIERKITEEQFIRVHQSVFINMDYIVSYYRDEITMEDGLMIHVPRSRGKDVRKAVTLYEGKRW